LSSKSWNSYFLKGPKLGSRIKTLNEAFLPKKSSKLSLKQALQIRSAEQLHCRQTLMILSGNKKMNKLFSIFFEKTFLSEEQFLTPKNPGGLAVHLDEDERLEEMLPWEMPLTFSDIKKRI